MSYGIVNFFGDNDQRVGVQGLLDLYPTNVRVAYGVSRLRLNYSGPAFIIRRQSDLATQSINFLANGEVNESAISSFVGVDNAFLERWYDQSGNGRDLVRATGAPTNGPRIATGGVIEKVNGKVAPRFDGTTQYMTTQTAGDLSSSTFKFGCAVFAFESISLSGDLAIASTNYNDANGFWIGKKNSFLGMQNWFAGNNNTTFLNTLTNAQTQCIWRFAPGTNNTQRWVGTSSVSLDVQYTTTAFGGTSTFGLGLGAEIDGEYKFKGYIQQFVAWNNDWVSPTGIANQQKSIFNL